MDRELFELTPESIHYLSIARKWAMFLSIIGFILAALLVLMGIFMGFMFNLVEMPQEFRMGVSAFSVIASVFYVIIALIYFIPVWFLFQFSQKLKHALETDDTKGLTESLKNLKNFFVSYGVLTIIGILLYCIFFAISFFAALGTVSAVSV